MHNHKSPSIEGFFALLGLPIALGVLFFE